MKLRARSLGLPELSRALVKAWLSAGSNDYENSRIAIVTNFLEEAFVPATGWEHSLQSLPERRWPNTLKAKLLRSTADVLVGEGYPPSEAQRLFERAHFIHLPADLSSLADALQLRRPQATALHGEVAATMILARALAAAAINRDRDPSNASIVTVRDVDGILESVTEASGSWLSALDRQGVLTAARFHRRPAESMDDFLRGVSARPQHISAGYAVARPTLQRELANLLSGKTGTLIVGPSGSGKSTLMWQVAFTEASYRCFVLNRVSEDQVVDIVRLLSLMTPDSAPPLLICAEDVGDDKMAGWSALVRKLSSDDRIKFLATCREESFSPGLTGGGSLAITRPGFDVEDAIALGRALSGSTRPITDSDLRELYKDSAGLLMEFVHLATTSKRLEDVLGEQVERLLSVASDGTKATVARLIVAADVAGLAVPITTLRTTGLTDEEISRVLLELNMEHVITSPEHRTVRGLHPLRSTYLLKSLHQGLPTLSETFAKLLLVMPLAEGRAIIQTWIKLDGDSGALIEAALVDRLSAEANLNLSQASDMLLNVEAALNASSLRRADLLNEELSGVFLLALTAGLPVAARQMMAPVQDASWLSPSWVHTAQELQRIKDLLEQFPGPRPIRQSVLRAVLPGDAPIHSAQLTKATLERLAGSDPFTAAQLEPVVDRALAAADGIDVDLNYGQFASILSQHRISQEWAASIVVRVAQLGPVGQHAVRDKLGLSRVQIAAWVLEQSGYCLIDLKESAFNSARARLIVPAPSKGLNKIEQEIRGILQDASLVAGLDLISATVLASDGTPFGNSDGAEEIGGAANLRIPLRVFDAFLRCYQVIDRNVTWFHWLSQTSHALNRISSAIEMIIGLACHDGKPISLRRTAAVFKDLEGLRRTGVIVAQPPDAGAPRNEDTSQYMVGSDSEPQQELLHRTTETLRWVPNLLSALLDCALIVTADRTRMVAIPDETVAKAQLVQFEVYADQLQTFHDFLTQFNGTAAQVAVERLTVAVDVLHAISGAHLLPSNEGRTIFRGLSFSEAGSQRLVSKLDRRLKNLEEKINASLLELTLRLEIEVGPGWGLVKAPRDFRLGRNPLNRWVLTSPPLAYIPTPEVAHFLRTTPWSDNRTVVAARTLGGDWHSVFWEWTGSELREMPHQSYEILVRHLTNVSGDSHAGAGASHDFLTEAIVWAGNLSRQASVHRLRGVSAADIDVEIEQLSELVQSVPQQLRPNFEALASAVAAELRGEATTSLAEQIDYAWLHQSAPPGPLLELLIECQHSLEMPDRVRNTSD